MSTKPTTFEDLLALFSHNELSLALGVEYVTARKMRERASVNVIYWPSLIVAAAGKGVAIGYPDLVAMAQLRASADRVETVPS